MSADTKGYAAQLSMVSHANYKRLKDAASNPVAAKDPTLKRLMLESAEACKRVADYIDGRIGLSG